MTAGESLDGGRNVQKRKRIHGHRQLCGHCWEEGGIRELNGTRKKSIRMFF